MGKKLKFLTIAAFTSVIGLVLLYALGWFGYTFLNDILTDVFEIGLKIIPNKYILSLLGGIICVVLLLIMGYKIAKIKNKLPF